MQKKGYLDTETRWTDGRNVKDGPKEHWRVFACRRRHEEYQEWRPFVSLPQTLKVGIVVTSISKLANSVGDVESVYGDFLCVAFCTRIVERISLQERITLSV